MLSRVASDEGFIAFRQFARSRGGSISILEGNCIQLYYGTTRLAELRYKKKETQRRLYWPEERITSGPTLASLIVRATAVEKRGDRLKEGKWQDHLLQGGTFRIANTNQLWLIIDREAVIGFDNDEGRKSFKNAVASELQRQVDAFHPAPPRWSKFKRPGDKCDLLVVSDAGELGCWEVKDGSNAALAWAPFQAWSYRKAFEMAVPFISEELKRMVRQKVELRLLGEEALSCLPRGAFLKVDAAVVVGNSRFSTRQTARLRESRSAVVPNVRVLELVEGSKRLSELDFE